MFSGMILVMQNSDVVDRIRWDGIGIDKVKLLATILFNFGIFFLNLKFYWSFSYWSLATSRCVIWLWLLKERV